MHIISKTARISDLSDLEDSIKGSKLIIGENVMIDSFVKIKYAGGIGNIEIGDNSCINSGCVLFSGNGINIGKNVLVAANCTFSPVNHQYQLKNKNIINQGFAPSKGGIVIEEDVWICPGVILLDGTHIKKGCVIAAGSIVSGITEEYAIYGGNPLKILSYRD